MKRSIPAIAAVLIMAGLEIIKPDRIRTVRTYRAEEDFLAATRKAVHDAGRQS